MESLITRCWITHNSVMVTLLRKPLVPRPFCCMVPLRTNLLQVQLSMVIFNIWCIVSVDQCRSVNWEAVTMVTLVTIITPTVTMVTSILVASGCGECKEWSYRCMALSLEVAHPSVSCYNTAVSLLNLVFYINVTIETP